MSDRSAVVVVNYASSHLVAANLPASTTDDQVVVVVDSWSDEAERASMVELAAEHGWILEVPAVNTGFGAGMNIGVRRALLEGATSVVLLNPDARVEPEGLRRLIDQVEADPTLLLAPRIVRPDGRPWQSTVMDLRLDDGTVGSSRRRASGARVMEWVSGAVMVMSAELWRRVEGFDDDYFLYWEDIDLCRRVHDAGGRVGVDESVTAVHDEGGTHSDGGARAKSEAFYYYNIRNRGLYATKWLPKGDRTRWAVATPRTALAVLLTGGRRQFVQGLKPWRAYARGVLASYRVMSTAPRPATGPRVRVLESFPTPTAATNPYITQLHAALAADPQLAVRCWSWWGALSGGYDVFHTHWTEALIESRGRLSTAARRLLFGVFLVRLRLTRTPIVRTVHNLERPSGLSWTERRLLDAVDRLTAARVVLNEFTPVPAGAPNVVIPHGHYRDWFAAHPTPPAIAGRIAFIGKIRRYKNVEGLAQAFSALPRDDKDFSLHIAGKPSSRELARALESGAASDPRISLTLGFVSDADLVREVGESELVVLPYHEMHNSGSVLAALSLNRPVLVPDNAFNRALADEVGPGWVVTFDGALTADVLVEALHKGRVTQRSPSPDLAQREWSDVGERHRQVFRQALAVVRPGWG